MQVSPTSPEGLKTNTTPYGAHLDPINPLSATLGVTNVSFVAQAVDWIPELFFDIIHMAFHHKGFSFISILQRCPNYLPDYFDAYLKDPEKTLLLTHKDGLTLSDSLSRTYKNQLIHDPIDINRARELASSSDEIPVGILYRNDSIPCYEDLRKPDKIYAPNDIEQILNDEFNKFVVEPIQR
jgi:2-oxoglutarate ferredoxin oxidoreductase subunit beta